MSREPYINKYLLTPLSMLFGEISAAQKPFYIDALKTISDEDLKRIFVELRDSHTYKRFPLIAEIKAAHKELRTVVEHGGIPKVAFEAAEKAINRAEDAMKTDLGKFALRNGVGVSLYTRVKRGEDFNKFTKEDILSWKRAWENAAVEMTQIKDVPLRNICEKTYQSISAKEVELENKYLQAA